MIERLLHFLRSFPASFLLAFLFIAVLWLYLKTQDAFLQRVIDTILGGLLGVVTGRGIQQTNMPQGDINIESTPEKVEEIKEEKEEK